MAPINFVDYFNYKVNGVRRITFNEHYHRASGEGAYLFANGLPIGMTTPGDCQGIKMEFDYGATATLTTGKMAHGLDIKMTMDKDWSVATRPDNATVRGARIQAVSEDDVSGRLTGAYINACAEGTSKTVSGYSSPTAHAGPGIIGIQARTEIGSSATITGNAAGILIFHRMKGGSTLTGEYRGLQIEKYLGTLDTVSSTVTAIHIGDDWGGANKFNYGIYMDSGVCERAIYANCATGTAATATKGVDITHTDNTTFASGYGAALYLTVTQAGAKTGSASASQFNAIALDLTISAAAPYITGSYFYIGKSGSPTLTSAGVYGSVIYLAEIGQADTMGCLSLEKANTNAGSSSDCFINFEGHAGTTTAMFQMMGNVPTNFLWLQEDVAHGFLDGGTTAGDQCVGHIKIVYDDATAGYINVYSDNS